MRLEAQAKAGLLSNAVQSRRYHQDLDRRENEGSTETSRSVLRNGRAGSPNSNRCRMRRLRCRDQHGKSKAAKKLLTKVVAGNLFSVRARPGAFSILYLNPPYDFDAEDGRTELSFLKHTLPYLTPGGLLLFVVPQKRITPRIARVLSAYFRRFESQKISRRRVPGIRTNSHRRTQKGARRDKRDVLAELNPDPVDGSSSRCSEGNSHSLSLPWAETSLSDRLSLVRTSLPKNSRRVRSGKSRRSACSRRGADKTGYSAAHAAPKSPSGNADRSGTDK